jgi:hypothetical protein
MRLREAGFIRRAPPEQFARFLERVQHLPFVPQLPDLVLDQFENALPHLRSRDAGDGSHAQFLSTENFGAEQAKRRPLTSRFSPTRLTVQDAFDDIPEPRLVEC